MLKKDLACIYVKSHAQSLGSEFSDEVFSGQEFGTMKNYRESIVTITITLTLTIFIIVNITIALTIIITITITIIHYNTLDKELAALPYPFIEPHGFILLAKVSDSHSHSDNDSDSEFAGAIACKPVTGEDLKNVYNDNDDSDDTSSLKVCEVKRLFVKDKFKGMITITITITIIIICIILCWIL